MHRIASITFFVALVGCNVGLPSATLGTAPMQDTTDAAPIELDASSDAGQTKIDLEEAGADAKTSGSAPYFNPDSSPLCKVVAGFTGCDPDKPACLFDATDAGADGECTRGVVCDPTNLGPPVVAAACRVVVGSAKPPEPTCSTAYKTGEPGNCTTSSDCGIGYECVGEGVDASASAYTGTCKHYCCDGEATCAALGSNGFCDIESVFHGIISVPVCTQVEPCAPFGAACSTPGETCTLVDEVTKQTACVVPGTAIVGEECATKKCGEHMACIGGMCRQLCKFMDGGSEECPVDQTCIASSLFGAYADVGLCGTSAAATP